MTLAEIRYGIAALRSGRRKQTLQDRLADEALPLFDDRIISLDDPASSAYAEIRTDARTRGTALGDFDALIAGIARSRGFTVATRDLGPFVAAQVQVINPFDTARDA